MDRRVHYIMITTRGVRYELNKSGVVLSRSNGPKDWDYDDAWVILGATTRHNTQHTTPLATIARDGIPGQGWIHDLDHGTRRMWGNERMRSLRRV